MSDVFSSLQATGYLSLKSQRPTTTGGRTKLVVYALFSIRKLSDTTSVNREYMYESFEG